MENTIIDALNALVTKMGGNAKDNLMIIDALNDIIDNYSGGGGGGSANPLEPFPLFPKATKTTEVIEIEELEYIGFLFSGLDFGEVNEGTVFKFTVGETSAYYPFFDYNSDGSINFHGLWVYPTEGKIFFSTNELLTAEVELDVMPYGFIETFAINGTWGDTYIETDKSVDDFNAYLYKWGSKSRIALLVEGDSNFFSSEIISVGSESAFINREEIVAIDGSTNTLQIYMSGYKWVSDNAIDWWEHTFEV